MQIGCQHNRELFLALWWKPIEEELLDVVTKDSFISDLTQVEDKINKRTRQGVIFVVPLVLLPAILLLPSEIVSSELLSSITVIFILLVLGGFGYSIHWGRNGRRYLYGLEIVNLISPPYPFVGSRVASVSRPPIHVIVRWGGAHILFIRILEPEITAQEKTRLPRFLSRKYYTHQIEGIRIARMESVFAFPRSKNEYVMGKGILYGLPLQRHFWVPKKSPISAEILLQIIKQLNLDLARKMGE